MSEIKPRVKNSEKYWQKGLKRTVAYKKQNEENDCNVRGNPSEERWISLRRWQTRQRTLYRNNDLSPSKVMTLYFLGFVFDVSDNNWKTALRDYLHNSETSNLSARDKNWIKWQLHFHQNNILTARRETLLRNAGFLLTKDGNSEINGEEAKKRTAALKKKVERKFDDNVEQVDWDFMISVAEKVKNNQQIPQNPAIPFTIDSKFVSEWIASEMHKLVLNDLDTDRAKRFVNLWQSEADLVRTLWSAETVEKEESDSESDSSAEESDGIQEDDRFTEEIEGEEKEVDKEKVEKKEKMQQEEHEEEKEEDEEKEKKKMKKKSDDDQGHILISRKVVRKKSPAVEKRKNAKQSGVLQRKKQKKSNVDSGTLTLTTLQMHYSTPSLTTELFEILKNNDLHENTSALFKSLAEDEKRQILQEFSIGQRAALRTAFNISI